MARAIVTLMLLTTVVAAQTPARRVIDFESDRLGQPPSSFTFALSGSGKAGVWVVKKDATSPDRGNVLAQTDADRTSYRFPLAVYNDVTAKDVDLSVRFRPVSGRGDQGAGLVWRYQDANTGNLLFVLESRRWPAQTREARVREILKIVGLEGRDRDYPGYLSGGEQQRVALARALVSQPDLLLLDEPLSSLDRERRESLRREIAAIPKALGMTLIYVTHDRDDVEAFGGDILAIAAPT